MSFAKIMSCCFPNTQSEVDRQLEIENLKTKLNFKILLLGSGESGKSTVLKQLKIIHKINPTQQELKLATNSLKRNTAQCMSILVQQAKLFGYDYMDNTEKARAASLEDFEMENDFDFTEEMANTIKSLWACKTIQETFARRKEYWLLDSADYYFENVERFVEDDFVPTEEDQIMARVMTTGLVETEIPASPISLTVVDVGGQRTERRKWIHCFDNVSGIVFCANLAGYNSVLFEDRTQNRMAECFQVFNETINKEEFKAPLYFCF